MTTLDVQRVPLADARPLSAVLRRGRVLRLALALTLAGAAGAAVFLASGLRAQPASIAPPDTSAILVVDASSSITSDVYRQIEHALHTAARSGERYGLVIFSDVAYEALPPGTPARELDPFRRFFTPVGADPNPRPGTPEPTAAELTFPPNPWTIGFSGGTRISTGLDLALDVLRRERIRAGSVVLLSDLADDATDLPRLAEVLAEYERFRVALRVVALSPAAQDRAVFESLLQTRGEVRAAPRPPRDAAAPLIAVADDAVPRSLLLLAVALLALLAANELALGRLTWRAR